MSLCVTPLFEGWDEYQHVAYVIHVLETGTRPILNRTLVSPSLVDELCRRHPQPRLSLVHFPGERMPDSYESFWGREAAEDLTPRASVPGPIPGPRLYQAQHSWWYYRMVGPLFQATGGVDDLTSSLAALRVLNLALTAGAVWMALGFVGVRIRDPRAARWIGLLIGVQPLLVMNGARFSSDAPGILLAVAAIGEMLKLAIDDRRPAWRAALVGVLVGAAILMKATNFALIPAAGVAWILAMMRLRPSPRIAMASLGAMVAGSGLLMAPDLAHNLATYGLPTPMQEAIENRDKGRTALDLLRTLGDFPALSFGHHLFTGGLMIQGNWSFVVPFQRFVRIYTRLVDLAILGLVLACIAAVARRGRSAFTVDSIRRAFPVVDSPAALAICVAVCSSYFAALLYHGLQSTMAWGRPSTGPWYAAPAIPCLLMLVGVGAGAWPRRIPRVLMASLLVTCVTAENASWWLRMLPAYSGGARGFEALGRITSLQPWYLTSATCLAALAASACILATAILSSSTTTRGTATASAIVGHSGPHRPTSRAGRRGRVDAGAPLAAAPAAIAQAGAGETVRG